MPKSDTDAAAVIDRNGLAAATTAATATAAGVHATGVHAGAAGAGAVGAAPTNNVGGVAGTGDSRLPASQREPGVLRKRKTNIFKRK